MIGSIIAGAGNLGGTVAGMGGGAGGATGFGAAASSGGFLSSLLLGSPGSQSAGLFGQGGQFGGFQTLNTLGMGLGLRQAFAGQSVAGTGRYIGLTKEGKKFEKSRINLIKERLSGANLATPFIKQYRSIKKGQLKREGQAQERAIGKSTRELASANVRTGAGLRAITGAAGAGVEGKVAPEKWDIAFKQQDFLKGISGAQDIINQQFALAIARGKQEATDAIIGQQVGASRGQALGDLARYLAYMKYPPYQMGR